MSAQRVFTADMWLVYADDGGKLNYQPWQDVDTAGPLIDAESGDDMELIGWVDKLPEDAA
jgi:hypothetical protein